MSVCVDVPMPKIHTSIKVGIHTLMWLIVYFRNVFTLRSLNCLSTSDL